MFEKFGNMTTEELNLAAAGLKEEGDIQSLKTLALENGLDEMDAEDYADGLTEEFASPLMAALGKLKVEEKALKPKGILNDWIGYIRFQVSQDPDMQITVREKDKTLTGCIGAILKWAFAHQWTVPQEIIKAAGVSASRVTLGEPAAWRNVGAFAIFTSISMYRSDALPVLSFSGASFFVLIYNPVLYLCIPLSFFPIKLGRTISF